MNNEPDLFTFIPNSNTSLSHSTLSLHLVFNVSFSLNLSDMLDFFPFRAVGHETEKWSVYRRYLEFYVLESKLTEFHGKKEPLPTDFE